MSTMQCMVVTDFGQPLERQTFALPTPKGREIVVQTLFAGVCHSDCHLHAGFFNLGEGKKMAVPFPRPFTLGHEIEGVVVAVGDALQGQADQIMGKRYAVYPWIGCSLPNCVNCSSGKDYLCVGRKSQRFCDGRTLYGGYGSHILVPDPRWLVECPPSLPPGLSAIYMCSGLTAFSALKKVSGLVSTAEDILIVGMGGVGSQAVIFANALLGGWPIVVELNPEKRALAAKLGCVALDPSDPKACLKAIRQASPGGRGVMGAIDFVGMEPTFKTCYAGIRKGGTAVVVGLFGMTVNLSMYEMILNEKSVVTSFCGAFDLCTEMMNLVKSKKMVLPEHEFRSITEANSALEQVEAGKAMGRIILRHDWTPTPGVKL